MHVPHDEDDHAPRAAGSDEHGHEPVLVYTLRGCVHCANARRRLERHDVRFTEQPVELLADGRRTLMARTGGSTAPQIVIGERAIGGADALARLDRRGVLDALFQGKRFPHAIVRRRATPGHVLRWLLTTPFGGACGPRAITVDLVDERGTRLERRPAASYADATLIADALNA